jgi:hypothetical protein
VPGLLYCFILTNFKIGTALGGVIAVPLFNIIIGNQLFIVFSGAV